MIINLFTYLVKFEKERNFEPFSLLKKKISKLYVFEGYTRPNPLIRITIACTH